MNKKTNGADFRIEGKDAANATFVTLLDGKATSTTSDPAAAAAAAFTLISDGVNPMEFRLVSNTVWGNEQPPERAGHPINVLLNGFDVSVVPEPTSMAAVGLVALFALRPSTSLTERECSLTNFRRPSSNGCAAFFLPCINLPLLGGP